MSGCDLSADENAPVLELVLIGRGEDAERLYKRLRCAGHALGIRIRVDWRREGIGESQVLLGDRLLFDRLLSTSEIEERLQPHAREWLANRPS